LTNFLPKNYKAYLAVKNAITNDNVKRRLHRFCYRYRLALAFEGINEGGQLGRSKAGYEAGMKVFLAYTALEEIYEAIKILDRNLVDRQLAVKSNIDIANKIRRNSRLKLLLLNSNNREDLQKNLDNFYKCTTYDILCIACAVRNLFAHGEFTAGGAGLNRKNDCKTFTNLANEVLVYCDKLLFDCVKVLEQRLKKK